MARKGTMAKERNPNWKGGRSVASNDYILVKMPDHPGADCRGYVYEHRLIAEQALGRPLRAGEIVHHRDENKRNNSPDNLEVMGSAAEHRVEHRAPDSNRRLPDDPNPIVQCACGCGAKLARYDSAGRPRDYMTGHNPNHAPRVESILDALSGGPLSVVEISGRTGATRRAVATALSKMKKRGEVNRVSQGVWCL